VIARQLGCDDQTVRNVIHGFNAVGLAVLHEGSSRPHRLRTAFSEEGAERLKDLLHRSPRDFGQERSTWTLELAAQVSFEQGIISHEVSDESVRRALKRLKTNWKRAKHWITSPDPQYLQKKPSGQRCRLSSSSPALFEGSEQGLALVTEAKARELLALSDGGLPSQFAPADTVKPGDALFQLLSMGRILLPPGRVGDRASVAQQIGVPVLATTDAAILRLEAANAALHVVVGTGKVLPVVALHQVRS
jgi:transposase